MPENGIAHTSDPSVVAAAACDASVRPAAKACKADAEKLCNNSWLIGASTDGRVINCLRCGGCHSSHGSWQLWPCCALPSAVLLKQVPRLRLSYLRPMYVHMYVRRDQKDSLSKPCARQVFKVQQAIANDYRADPSMAASCKADVERLCKDVKDGAGRKNTCLVRHIVGGATAVQCVG